MRLLGTNRLRRLADEGSDDVAGGVAALAAELRAAAWATVDDAMLAFPSARRDGDRIVLRVSEGAFVSLKIGCEAGCVVVEDADFDATRSGPAQRIWN